jgi:hypothetical protein
MRSFWSVRLGHAAFALLLTFSAVNLTVPGAIARTVVESAPDADDDDTREVEFALSASARQPGNLDRLATRFARRLSSASAGSTPSSRTAPGARFTSADPLGTRLRC